MCTPTAAACTAVNKKNLENLFGVITGIAGAATGTIDINKTIDDTKTMVEDFAISSCEPQPVPAPAIRRLFKAYQ